MVTDPVCGMQIEEKSAVGNSTYRGQRYYFCSVSCRDKFVANPTAYLKPTPAAAATKVIYRCPMHPEVQQDVPGNCPKCGMVLQPEAASQSAPPVGNAVVSGAQYTCPMRRARAPSAACRWYPSQARARPTTPSCAISRIGCGWVSLCRSRSSCWPCHR